MNDLLKHYTDIEQESLSTLEGAMDSCRQTLAALEKRAQKVRERMELINEIRLTLALARQRAGDKLTQMIQIKHFELAELASKTDPAAWSQMRLGTVLKLEKARELYGQPVTITHAFRTTQDVIRLKKAGYEVAADSAHQHGYAVDISANLGTDIEAWKKLLDALWAAGFRRFGIMRGAVHVDDDPKRPAPAVWKYSTTSPQIWVWAQGWIDSKGAK